MTAAYKTYDVVIVGGGMYGCSIAWWLTQMADFTGRVLVVERDPTYETAATSLTNSCIRQQFTNETNVRISQFGAEFIKNFRHFMGDDPDVPELHIQSYGYLYLADTKEFSDDLRAAQQIQARLGAGTKHMTREEIASDYPFFQLDDIYGANHNLVDEGYFDGGTVFDWFKRMAQRNGVEFIAASVEKLVREGSRVTRIELADGTTIGCGAVVDAAGTRARQLAQTAGVDIPVEPRRRYTYIFDAAEPLDRDLPLTIDPSGVHFRTDGRYYLAGGRPDEDPAVDVDDFNADHALWEEKFWPIIATRIPQFERIKLVNMWVGHYDYNTLDQNAILGPHPNVDNLIFANGFSGHGLQQAPALGRGLAEWIAFGSYQTLDLTQFSVERVLSGKKFLEKAVI